MIHCRALRRSTELVIWRQARREIERSWRRAESWRVGGVDTSSSLGCSIPGRGYDRPSGATPAKAQRNSAPSLAPLVVHQIVRMRSEAFVVRCHATVTEYFWRVKARTCASACMSQASHAFLPELEETAEEVQNPVRD